MTMRFFRALGCAALLSGLCAEVSAARSFRFDELARAGRVGAFSVSPDGQWVAYAVGIPDVVQNRTNSALWLAPSAGGPPRRLTAGDKRDSDPAFSPDGGRLAFLSNRDGRFADLGARSLRRGAAESNVVSDGNQRLQMGTRRAELLHHLGCLSGLLRRGVSRATRRRPGEGGDPRARRATAALPPLGLLAERASQSHLEGAGRRRPGAGPDAGGDRRADLRSRRRRRFRGLAERKGRRLLVQSGQGPGDVDELRRLARPLRRRIGVGSDNRQPCLGRLGPFLARRPLDRLPRPATSRAGGRPLHLDAPRPRDRTDPGADPGLRRLGGGDRVVSRFEVHLFRDSYEGARRDPARFPAKAEPWRSSGGAAFPRT